MARPAAPWSGSATLVEVLRRRAEEDPEATAYTFLPEGEADSVRFSRAELDARARAIGAALQAVLPPGGRAVLLYAPGLDYVAGFFGCLYAGVIAVPAYPPDPSRIGRTLPRLRAIVADAQAEVVLTTAPIASLAEAFFQLAPDLRERRWIATDTLPPDEGTWKDPGATADTVAFLQYTSGSTGSPKGVILTHGNLVANLSSIRRAMEFSPSTVMVSWLPPYHDMGLIGGILAPLYAGGTSVLMAPTAFLQRPLRWVAAVSRFHGTVSGGPNFAFDLAVKKTTEEDRRALDLSAWRVAFSGAEPVRSGTVARFIAAFGASGLHHAAVYPCYGLAEATLMVTGGRVDAEPVSRTIDAGALEQRRVREAREGEPGARTVVGCGEAVPDDEVTIVDPETLLPCPPGRVGEIWVHGPNVALGYWQKQEATVQAFHARLPGDDRRWLRTGDLGYLDGPELYVTGRHKDLIILFGRNHYPQDIEQTAEESHPALRRGCAAAFALETAGEERLAIVIEIERGAEKQGLDPVYDAMRAAVAETHDVRPHTIALVRAGSIPKTSSGKIQRRECRAALVAGTLGEIGKSALPEDEPAAWIAPRTPVEEAVARAFSEVLGEAKVGARDDFFALGGHSLMGTQLVTRLRAAFGVELPLRDLFEAPTVARLAARIEAALSGGAKAPVEPLVRQAEGEPKVASFGQEGLWLLAQLDPGDASYRLPVRMRVQGPLDAALLGRALTEIVRRHEVLRTTFVLEEGRPVPVVHEAADLPIPVVSLASLPEPDRAAALRREELDEIGRPFDLIAGPLLRARLVALGAEDHVLLLTVHHIVADAWTMSVVTGEMAALYGAFVEGKPSPLPDLPVQYADFARWQRRHVAGEVEERLLAYWRGELAGASAALELPTDRPRPPVLGHRGGERMAAFSPELTAGLGALARREGVTLFMLLLAAFEVLILRYTEQTDFVVGTPIANRRHVETEGLAGFFVNTLALRARLSPAQTFRDLLVRVKEACLGAYAHQDIPFERLVQVLAPERDASRSPLFQVMLVLQNAPVGRMEIGGAKIEGSLLHTASSKFDLTLTFTEGKDGLALAVEHSTDLFDAETIDRLIGHLRVLCEGVVARPSDRLRELPLMGEDEQAQMLAAGRASAVFRVDAPLHAIFEAQVDRTPEAPAVTSEDGGLSYRDLDRRANQVAHALRRRGVERGTLVGLCVERSLDLVVGLVAILKAGGAYVPLDPSYPRERLAFMIEDAGAAVVVTHRDHAAIFGGGPGGPSASLLRLDVDAASIAAELETRPEGGATADDLAYVLYTSGSTGRPKGTMVSHRNVARLFPATQGWYGFGPADVWTVFHSYAFDFSVWELWGALLHGGRAIVVPYWVSRSPEAFLDLLARERVTVLNQTPSAFRALVHAEEGHRVDLALRWVIFGGEALDVGDLAPWWDRHGDTTPQLVNMYGITETTVHVTYRPVSRADLERPWSSVIGCAIPDLSIHVLDPALSPVPVGVAGELCVGGAGVARGYLNRPELSAERFVSSPFEPGARLYRSGDLARRSASGELAYLGRIDQQVKIRGFRIELGEIEAALGACPGVRAAVILARDDAPEGRRLVAYVVPAEGAAPAVATMRAFLKNRLPEYMVPSAFVTLPALPLTVNGKVDRAALPAPEVSADREDVAPRGPVEEAVCGILADVLRRPEVGPRESFFEIGGHSLLATQVISRLRATFGVDLPLRALFEAPAAAELAARVDAALRGGAGVEVPPIGRAPREGGHALSFAQERMWFLHRLDPGDTSYLVPGTLRLEGPLDREALGRALDEVVARHEVLRTRVVAAEGRASAIVDEDVRLPMPVVDLGALPEGERDAALSEAIAAEARRPFDLATEVPIRVRLFAMGPEDHALLVVMHHIATDGWSVAVLQREVAALYEAFQAGLSSPLPALPVQYASFAAWQRRWMAGEVLDRQLSYWKAQLSGAPAALDLPVDRPRPAVMSHRGGRAAFAIDGEVWGALGALGRREGATPFMVVLAVFDLLLRRYAGQRDVVVGTPIAGRTQAETEGLIGLFVNTLALRVEVDDDEPFTRLLQRAREKCLGAYAHQDLPFERLVEELHPARDLGRTPLFQVMLALENAPREAGTSGALGGLASRALAADSGTTKFELTLTLSETPQGALGTAEYFADLFDASTIERMLGHLSVLFEGVVEGPGRRAGELSLLSAAERAQVLVAWNRTAVAYPEGMTADALFEAQVDRTPDADAIVFLDERITFRELDQQANRIANRLVELGVAKGALVGLAVQRSPALVAGMLGVMKAGCGYLPLDPAYPEDRLAFMMADASMAVLLADEGALARMPAPLPPVLRIDAGSIDLAGASEVRPGRLATIEDVAYVIYTSGSTGRPKGVVVEHRGLGNLAAAQAKGFGVAPASRVLQFASSNFDASVSEVLVTLLAGATLVLAPQDALLPGAPLLRTLVDQRVTVATIPPSALAMLPHADLPELGTIVVAGEACSGDLVARWAPGRRFVNAYGPTEASVCATMAQIDPSVRRPTIGRPIDNVRVYLLDDQRGPVPVGVPGEMYIGGVGLARGYLNRPDLTAEKFVASPLPEEPGARLYRTGDLCRLRPDGEIEFLGRIDHQVKIRGFRIELGEIEALLARHEGLRDAVVIAREDTPGDPRLVAYVVPSGSRGPGSAELRRHLGQALPGYMVPAAFVELPALPLSPNGKVDTKALPAPDLPALRDHVAPRGPVEEAVCRIFGEVLKIDPGRIGVHDGFFELGGHSLLATQVVSRVRATFGVDPAVRVLFEAPTPAELGARIEAELRGGAMDVAPPLVAAPREGAPVLSFAQERMWFLHGLDPHDASYLVSGTLRLDGPLDHDALTRALEEVVRRHEVLRTRFAVVDGRPAAVVEQSFRPALPRIDLSRLPEAERVTALGDAIAADARRPLDLEAAPPIRVELFALGETDHVLLVVIHHIATDGWSMGVLQREVAALYEAFHAGQPSPLPDLPLQYADFAAWQRAWLSGEVLGRELSWWKTHLAGAPEALDLPTDRPRPAVMSRRGGWQSFTLAPELSAALVALARREGATLFMVLLAAFDVLLSRWSGQRDIVVGTPIAGRTRAEIEGLVGFFVNTLVLRATLDGEEPFRGLLSRVREACLGAYAHQDLPFERLVEELRPTRDLGRTPLFQAVIALQNAPQEDDALGGLRRRGTAADTGTAKFDLTLTLNEARSGIEGNLEYAADLFDAATIARMLGHLRVLCEGVAVGPERAIADLPILPPREREQVLSGWNRTATGYPREATIDALFEAEVDRDPRAIAAALGDASLTYAELDRRANRLAHHLAALGVGLETTVGVVAQRSLEMVAAMLAILKAGGAYLPLDPDQPPARLAWMAEDMGLRTVVTAGGGDRSWAPEGVRVVDLSADAAQIDAERDDRPARARSSRALAYSMYTSGSTGRPKRVGVEHRSVVRLVRGAGNLRFGPEHVLLHHSPLAFDASTLEIWAPLLNGGRLAILPPGPPSAARLGEAIRRHGVTTLWLTAAFFNVVIEEDPDALGPLRQLLAGGEALSLPHIQRARCLLPGVALINGYGPTENTTFTTTHRITSAEGSSIPIGRPIANSRAYVLDERLEPTPIGVPGELYAGGDGVARGYLGLPDLTAPRFVPDPFGGEPGARLYRTGDRVRWLADGTLAFLGRLDDQVKLRGFRIELGEIEAALREGAEVREAVVLALEDAPGSKRLCAYVVPADPFEAPSAASLRARLLGRLPEYMVPSAFVVLDRLPITPNGKLDKRALPLPEASTGSGYVAPRGPVEEAVAGVFADVLRAPRVGAHDGFFELGGHSLSATQAASRLRATFGVDLPVRAIFEAPTPAALSERIEAALGRAAGVEAPPIVRAPRDGAAPLSFAQERMWFLQELDPDDVSYLVPAAIRLEGALDRGALARTLDEIVRRHEVLRTRCARVSGSPVAVVDEGFRLALPVVDLAGLPGVDREHAWREAALAEMRRPFDLGAEPPIRAKLFALGEADALLLVVVHHIATDAWSVGALRSEVSVLYEAFAAGRPSPLPELEVQYADYAAWQRRWLSGEILERQVAFWKGELQGAPDTLALPVDRPRPAVRGNRGGRVIVDVPETVTSALRAVAKREGATLYMVLLAALSALLYRLSGQSDLVVGSPIAGRTRAETEGMVGLFLNMLALRARVEDEGSFTALLARVKETCLGAYAHQDLPFERLVQEIGAPRDPGRTPVFQVFLNVRSEPAEGSGIHLAGLTLHEVDVDTETTKFDLTFILSEGPRGIRGTLTYRADLLDAGTAERWVGHLHTLLAGVVADPSRPVGELPLVGAEERQRLIAEWNAPIAGHDAGACAHALFEAQADRTPAAEALVAGAERMTFEELDRHSSQLAHRLRRMGVGPDTVVGLCLDRTAGLIVGLLGILKAGGAYLPLDPTLPRHRLEELLDEAGAPGVVTADRVADALPADRRWSVRLDAEARALAGESAARLEPLARPEHLAYVLFTSGSTGRPKGVAVEHRNLSAYVHGAHARIAPPPDCSYAHVSTIAADLGNTTLLLSLCTGGTLHLIPEDLTKDPAALGAHFAEQGIDVVKIAPSHLSALLTAPRPEQVLPRRALVLGGEALRWDVVERIQALAPGCRVLNHYGPTETCVGVIAGAAAELQREAPIVPLGRPLAAARVYLLDPQLEPVPLGVAGEVYVGGAQVARGYLGRPDQTAERFVPDPFGLPGARRYRTGDRARRFPDGALLFLGRVDHQVKVRGYRVELGEIEAALEQHPAVRDAVVLAFDDAAAGKRLAAFVAGEPVAPAELGAFLAQRLPGYMVPGAITVLDVLPVTPNGKVDRRALEALEPAEQDGDAREGASPRTTTEELLEAIWADVFGREHVGVHERFEALGGHSLLAIQVIARVRDAFQVEVPLRAIFEAPTIAELAERVEALQREGTAVAPPIEAAPRGGPQALSFAQERLWFLDRMDPDSPFYNVPSAQRLVGPLDAVALERAIREVVRRHEVLRTTFTMAGDRPAQVIHEEVALRLDVDDLQALPAAERETRAGEIVSAEARRPFDLERGPVLRARLIVLGPEEHVLVVVRHHIVSDAASQAVLLEEVTKLYAAFQAGAPSPLPPLPIQYADYAAWQRRWLSGDVLERQVAWWKAHLSGAPAALEMPTDRPRPAVMSHRGGQRSFSLLPALSRALGALGRREGATLFMVLLSAFDVLLSRYTGQRDVVVGTPIAGRTRAETEGLIGFFVNTLALRVELGDGDTFLTVLARVREACLSAYAHQDLPFERLVEELNPVRDLSRTPLFQAVLALQNARRERETLAALSGAPMIAESGTAKFDLTLTLSESPRGLDGVMEYASDLFDVATIDRMLGHLRVLLEGVAEGPERHVLDLPLLSAEERGQVLAWNGVTTGYPRGATIDDLFEDQVDRAPDAIAASFGEESLSYAELDRRANRLCRHLTALGVAAETAVGLYAQRSIEMLVAMLGILKAGAAYAPLDGEQPDARLAFIAEDLGLRVIVAAGASAAGRPTGSACVVDLAADAARIDREPEDRPRRAGSSDGLAYAMYTSGSTGQPKGVGVAHRAVVRLVRGTGDLRFGAEHVLLQHSPLAFDASTLEIWAPLLNGGRLGVLPPGPPSAEALREAIVRHGVTTVWLTAALFNFLIEQEPEALRPLRHVFAGGEALSVPHLKRALAVLPDVALTNGYGPTENTTFTTTHRIRSADGPIPIGRAILGTTVYVLDERLEPAPIGVPGELYAGGDGVARGYLYRPELTAERFVPDPFGREPGARLYRTGDRVRWLEDGTIAFLGRRDDQIKLRGHRIELGEIEAVLLACPEVQQAVVMARDDGLGVRLVAYVVPADPAAQPEALRARLRERLPEYMVPSTFVMLSSLPRTPNSKVDRAALPAPDAPAESDHVAPESPLEQALCRIFAEVLRAPRVGVHDNFFAIGGDSILSMQVVSRARAAGIALTPKQIFQHQTVAELASSAGVVSGAQIDEGPVTGPVPLTPIQRWWLADDPVDPHHFNQTVLLEALEPIDEAALSAAVGAVLEHHDALRLRVSRGERGWEQGIVAYDGEASLERVDLGSLPEGARAAAMSAVAERTQASLDLAAGPMLRAVLFAAGPGGHDRLLVAVHHFAVDGVSWRFLLEDLWSAYEARRRGEAVPLPPRTTSLQRWSQRLLEHAGSEAVAEERGYWLAAARRKARPLPVDHPGGESTEQATRSVETSLSAEETEALLRAVPEAYRTRIDEVLLTALAQALWAWTGADAALVDLEGHGREEIFDDLAPTRTVGWFTVMYPVVLERSSGGLGDTLMSVKEQLRAVPNHGMGYGLLRYLRDDEGLRAALAALPQAEVSFNYLGQLDQALPEGAPLRGARESAGPSRSPRARRRHLIDVVVTIAGGHLSARFSYAETRHRRATVELLGARFMESLRALIAHCVDPRAGGLTPSDLTDRGRDITPDVLDFIGAMDPNAGDED